MSSVSESQYKAQPDQQNSSYDLSAAPMKRKRGRPRKDEVCRSEPNRKMQQCRLLQSPIPNHGLVGQEVSGSFIGVFDAGYLLTVQVGSSGPILRGMVFDPHLAVPVSTENDVAPHLPMLRRNEFSYPVAEGLINQGAVSSQAYMAQKDGSIQYIQDKEPPTTSSFTSPVPSALQLNLMEVTSHRSHVPQAATETREPKLVSETSNVILEGAAAKTSDQSPLNSSQLLHSEVKNEHICSVELSNVSEAPANVYEPSHVSHPLDTYTGMSLYVSKASDICRDTPAEATSFNVSNLSDVPKEAGTRASGENIPKKLLSASTGSSLDVSNVMHMDNLKVDASEGFGRIMGCMTQLSHPNIAVAESLEDASTSPQAFISQP